MKPVLVLQNLSSDGPSYLATWLQRAGQAFEVRDAEAGHPYPDGLRPYSALALLGGEMGANDPLPHLRHAERLVLQAMAHGIPVIGHCLGGQLMAKALGARVAPAPAPEIGWQPIRVADTPAAAAWLGVAGQRVVMQWHFDNFALPPGAEALARSANCPAQAFAVGPHLALQFHLEIDADKLQRWSLDTTAGYQAAQRQHPASVQTGAAMRHDGTVHLAAHQALADRIYARWLGGRC